MLFNRLAWEIEVRKELYPGQIEEADLAHMLCDELLSSLGKALLAVELLREAGRGDLADMIKEKIA